MKHPPHGRYDSAHINPNHDHAMSLPAPSLPHTLTFLSGSGSPQDVNIRSIFSRSPLAWTS